METLNKIKKAINGKTRIHAEPLENIITQNNSREFYIKLTKINDYNYYVTGNIGSFENDFIGKEEAKEIKKLIRKIHKEYLKDLNKKLNSSTILPELVANY